MIFVVAVTLPKLTGVLCCDSHEFVDAEDARPPTTLPPPTYVHTYTLAVAIPYTDNVYRNASDIIVSLFQINNVLLIHVESNLQNELFGRGSIGRYYINTVL